MLTKNELLIFKNRIVGASYDNGDRESYAKGRLENITDTSILIRFPTGNLCMISLDKLIRVKEIEAFQ